MTAFYEDYYAQTDADKRKKLLDDMDFSTENPMEGSQQEQPAYQLIRTLWQMRYVDPKSGRRVDLFLWEILELICLYGNARFLKKSTQKDARKALKALGVQEAEKYGREGEEILYQELCNAVRLYLHTCESKSYHKRLFGLSEMKEPEWQKKVSKDIWRLSTGVPRRLDMTREFSVLSKAAKDEFCRQFENGEALLREREEEFTHGKNQK